MRNITLSLILFLLNTWSASAQVKEKAPVGFERIEDTCILYASSNPRWPVDVWYGVPEHVKRSASDRVMLQFVANQLDFNVLGCGTMEGKIIVQFTVEIDGHITNPKLVRKLYPPLDEQVLRIVESFPRFVPGQQTYFQEDGTPVLRPTKMLCTLPIRIKLE